MSDDDSRTAASRAQPVVRDYELDDVADAGSPEQMKALGDPLRQLICDLVLERAMSVSELADLTDRPKGTVAYHVDVLVDAGLLKVVRTRRVRAVEERFYGRVARTFTIHDDSGDVPFIAEVLGDFDREAAAEFVRAEAAGVLDPESKAGWGTATYRRARIPVDRVAEFSRRLEQLAGDFVDEPRSGDVEYGLYLTIFPTNRLRRQRPAGDERNRA